MPFTFPLLRYYTTLIFLCSLTGGWALRQQPGWATEEAMQALSDAEYKTERDLIDIDAADYAKHAKYWDTATATATSKESAQGATQPEGDFVIEDSGDLHVHMIATTSTETLTWAKHLVMESVFHHHPKGRLTLHATLGDQVSAYSGLLEPLRARGHDAEARAYSVDTDCLLKLQGTKIEEEVGSEVLQKFRQRLPEYAEMTFWFAHQADLGRLCLLYLHGGLYLDTDALLVKPVPSQWENVVGLTEHGHVNGAAMRFEAQNEYLAACLVEFLTNYRPTEWGYNCPGLLTRVIQKDAGQFVRALPIPATSPVHFTKARAMYWQRDLADAEVERKERMISEEAVVVHMYMHTGGVARGHNLGTKLLEANCILCH